MVLRVQIAQDVENENKKAAFMRPERIRNEIHSIAVRKVASLTSKLIS